MSKQVNIVLYILSKPWPDIKNVPIVSDVVVVHGMWLVGLEYCITAHIGPFLYRYVQYVYIMKIFITSLESGIQGKLNWLY